MLRQAARWPHWGAHRSATDWKLVIDIERRTWTLADHITCPSEYVRVGLLDQGVPCDRVSVIPYPIDTARFGFVDRRGRDRPLVVGFVGAVGIRKGAPAFIEAARHFSPDRVRFVMVGPIELAGSDTAPHKGSVELTGAVPRSQVANWLERFDVFLFPSTCEGSAGAVIEAMATGLPVITTPNSGTVIRHGVEGFVCACNDISDFVQSIDQLVKDPALRTQMGRAALERARTFDLGHYGRALDRLFRTLISSAEAAGAGAERTPHVMAESAQRDQHVAARQTSGSKTIIRRAIEALASQPTGRLH
jgi:glycosyltransferase involved in cell wall biosynthesis